MIIQQGLAGKLSSHQSLASPVSFQWVEEKAKSILNQDDWSALKYHIREYARGNLTVNELGLSLLDLFDTDQKVRSFFIFTVSETMDRWVSSLALPY